MSTSEEVDDKLEIVMIGGRIRCVYLNDYRIAGSKPYVSENPVYKHFSIKAGEIAKHLSGAARAVSPKRRYPWVDGQPQTLMYLVLHCVETAGGLATHFQHQLKTLGVDVSVRQVSAALQCAKKARLAFNRGTYWQLTEKRP